jgi:hypothetical protein
MWGSKMAVFWVVAPCSLVEVYQRFRGPCCLHHQGEQGPLETLANFYQTTRLYNPEDRHLRNHRRENLKSCGVTRILKCSEIFSHSVLFYAFTDHKI